MRETAQKVVELQRTVMKLRSKLKQKEDVENENTQIMDELNEYRAKFIDSQKKHAKAADQVKELQAMLEQQAQAN